MKKISLDELKRHISGQPKEHKAMYLDQRLNLLIAEEAIRLTNERETTRSTLRGRQRDSYRAHVSESQVIAQAIINGNDRIREKWNTLNK